MTAVLEWQEGLGLGRRSPEDVHFAWPCDREICFYCNAGCMLHKDALINDGERTVRMEMRVWAETWQQQTDY